MSNKKAVLRSIIIILLTANYLTNPLKIVQPIKFKYFDQYDENMALDRLLLSYNQSVFDHHLFSGRFGSHDSGYAASNFRKNKIDKSLPYSNYYSQPGGQLLLYSFITKYIPIQNNYKLKLLNILCALFTSFFLVNFAFWAKNNISTYAAASLIIYFFISPVLLCYAKSPWWSIYVFFMPLVIITNYYEIYLSKQKRNLFLSILALILFKYFINGFEFITSYICAILIPIFYFEIKKLQPRPVFKAISLATLGIITGILFSLFLLCIQIGFESNFCFAINHINYSFAKRANGFANSSLEKVYQDAQNTNVFYVIDSYLKKPLFTLNIKSISFNYYHLLILNILFGLVAIYKQNMSDIKLFYASIFAFLGSLSWFFIFKGHAFHHNHLDEITLHIVWVPFSIIFISSFFQLFRKQS
jgi:hypothetical protein